MTNRNTVISIILLLALGFWAGSVWTEDNMNRGAVEISLDRYNFNGIESGKALFTKIDSAEQEWRTKSAIVGDLGSKALSISDLPNGTISFAQAGSMKYLMLKNNTFASGYQEIREENGLIICRTGSINHLLDKSGKELLIVPEGWIDEENAHIDGTIERIKAQDGKTEESKSKEIEFLERHRSVSNGYQKIYFEGNSVYGQLGSRTVYIGDL